MVVRLAAGVAAAGQATARAAAARAAAARAAAARVVEGGVTHFTSCATFPQSAFRKGRAHSRRVASRRQLVRLAAEARVARAVARSLDGGRPCARRVGGAW